MFLGVVQTIAGSLLCCIMSILHCLLNLLYYQHHFGDCTHMNTKIFLTTKIWIGTDWIKTPIHL